MDVLLEFQGKLKKISKKNLDALKKRIVEDGFISPFFVWDDSGDYRILDGHGRLFALCSLREEGYDLPMFPVVFVDAKDEAEARARLLSITSQYGEFDTETLGEWLAELDASIAETLRIVDGEIKIAIAQPAETIGDDDVPDVEETAVSVFGEIYELGTHRLLCGDSADRSQLEWLLDGDKANLVFTDPPYGVSIQKKNEFLNTFQPSERCSTGIEDDELSPADLKEKLLPVFKNIREFVMAEDCSVFVTAPQGGELGMMMMMMKESGLTPRHVLIWKKNAPTFSMGRLDYDYQHEPILLTWGKRHKRPMKGKHKTSIWEIDKPRESKMHPTMKPVELVENALLNNSDPGDISFDAYTGSGTTLIASARTGRVFRGLEISPHYCDVIRRRWATWAKENGHEVGSGGLD